MSNERDDTTYSGILAADDLLKCSIAEPAVFFPYDHNKTILIVEIYWQKLKTTNSTNKDRINSIIKIYTVTNQPMS